MKLLRNFRMSKGLAALLPVLASLFLIASSAPVYALPLGIVAGILGIIGDIVGLNFFAILLLIWWVPVGYKLYKLGGLKP